MSKIKTAIFPVGGLGTRFLPATKAMPKEMLPILDKPLIQYAFEEARDAGIEKFIFVTGRNKNIIANHFDHAYELERVLEEAGKMEALERTRDWIPEAGNIAFTRQQRAKGLGHAVLCARNYVDGPFALLLPDELFLSKTPVIKQMVDAYDQTGANVIAVRQIPKADVKSYGVIAPKASAEAGSNQIPVSSLVEKPQPEEAPSDLAIVGRYVLKPEIFDYLEKQEAGHGGEIQITDSINRMTQEGASTIGMKVDGQRFDCGSRTGWLEANLSFALSIPELKDGALELMQRMLKAQA